MMKSRKKKVDKRNIMVKERKRKEIQQIEEKIQELSCEGHTREGTEEDDLRNKKRKTYKARRPRRRRERKFI